MVPFSSPLRLGKQLLPLVPLTFLLWSANAAWAGDKKQTLCCRTSGGTRSSCLSDWIHLVPPENRVNPGQVPQLGLLQGVSATPTGMSLRLLSMQEKLIKEYVLEPQSTGVTVLTLPPQKDSSMVWESFPSCSPDKRPTRTVLDWDLPQSDGPAQQLLRQLNDSCGSSIDTAELLRAIELESLKISFPPTLPVRCVTLSP